MHRPAALLLALLFAACGEKEEPAPDKLTGSDEDGDGSDGSDGSVDTAHDTGEDTAAPAPLGCVLFHTAPRTLPATTGGELRISLRCEDPDRAAATPWTLTVDGLPVETRGEESGGGWTLVANVPAHSSFFAVPASLRPEGGEAIDFTIRMYGSVHLPGPPPLTVDPSTIDTTAPYSARQTDLNADGAPDLLLTQLSGDALYWHWNAYDGTPQEGKQTLTDTAFKDGIPQLLAGDAAYTYVVGLGSDGKSFRAALLDHTGNGTPIDVYDRDDIAGKLHDNLAAIGDIQTIHRVALVTRDDGSGLPGLAVLATLSTKSGDAIVLAVNSSYAVSTDAALLAATRADTGAGALTLVGDADLRDGLASPGSLAVVAISYAERDAASQTLPLRYYVSDGGAKLRLDHSVKLQGVETAAPTLARVDRAVDADGKLVEFVAIGDELGDQAWAFSVGETSPAPLQLPDAPAVFVATHWDEPVGQPDSGLALQVSSPGNKGKILTSDGLEYDRLGPTAPIHPTLGWWTLSDGDPAVYARGGFPTLITKQLDKSTPNISSLRPVGGTPPVDPTDPDLTLGDTLLLGAPTWGGPLLVTRAEHPDRDQPPATPVALFEEGGRQRILGDGGLFAPAGDLATAAATGLATATPLALYAGETADLLLARRPDGTLFAADLADDGALLKREDGPAVDALAIAPTADDGLQVIAHKGDSVAVMALGPIPDAHSFATHPGWVVVTADDFGVGPAPSSALAVEDRAAISVPTQWSSPELDPLFGLTLSATSLPRLGEEGAQLNVFALPWSATTCPIATAVLPGGPGLVDPAAVLPLFTSAAADCADLPVPIAAADLFGLGQPGVLLRSAAPDAPLWFLWTATDGTLALAAVWTPPAPLIGPPAQVSAADWNGDGLDDLLLRFSTDGGPTAALLLSDGQGGWLDAEVDEDALVGLFATPGAYTGWPQRATTLVARRAQADLRE